MGGTKISSDRCIRIAKKVGSLGSIPCNPIPCKEKMKVEGVITMAATSPPNQLPVKNCTPYII